MATLLERSFASSPFRKALAEIDLGEVLALGRKLLTERPLTRAELGPLLARQFPADANSLAYAVSYLEPLVQTPPRGLWRRGGQARWTTAEAWLARPPAPRLSREELVLRYLGAFGPATIQDVQAWSGLAQLRPVMDALRERLAVFRDEQGRELVDLPDGPLPDPAIPAPPRFLPPFDNAILSHADRARIIAADDRDRVSADRLMRTFLVNGFVAGTWRLDGVAVRVKPFRALNASERHAVEEEAWLLSVFLAPEGSAPEVQLDEPDTPS